MNQIFPFSQFLKLFPDEDLCLEEIKRLRFPKGITCVKCQKITRHYKLKNRKSYTCKICRSQTYPLAETMLAKTTTPLQLWFYAMFLLIQTRKNISIKQLQLELGVTYKTAWRLFNCIRELMLQNNGDLLKGPIDFDEKYMREHGIGQIRKWTFFNRFEITLTEKKEKTD